MNTLQTIIYHLAAAVLAALVMTACQDDHLALPDTPGQGEGDVSLTLSFGSYGLTGGEGVQSRAGTLGDAIADIDDVCVMAYSTTGSLVSARYYSSGVGLDVTASANRPAAPAYENDAVKRGTVSLTLPYGTYRIYALANMGDLTGRAEIANESTMRKITFDWNSEDIRANRQMWGAVTPNADDVVANRTAPAVTVDRTSLSMHAWLHRAASKATIAYDATALNDNVYIYITSAQVRDIPLTCTAIDHNKPQLPVGGGDNLTPAQCLTDGQTISYLATAGDYTSTQVKLAKGTAYGGLKNEDELRPGDNVHTIDEKSLYFFENMQGTHPDKHQYNKFTTKDNVLYGTYLEVKAYYVNRSGINPSQGEIIYRYMLGMNDTDDFNAQRNTHYRVTLRFIGDANNPDWHIEYERPDKPTVEVPSPMYISYLYNQQLDVPVVCYYDKNNYYVKSVTAEIIDNPYTNPQHKYSSVSTWTNNKYGFLSLNSQGKKTTVDMNASGAYLGTKSLTPNASYDESIKGMRLSMPVYTRPLNLMAGTSAPGFSGNNHFTHMERKAKVRVTVVYGSTSNASYTSSAYIDVEVIQVKRVVNPKGCWRPGDSTKPFTFTLMETGKDATNISSIAESSVGYTPTRSNGPWTARVYTETYSGKKPGVDWIQISPKGANAWRQGSDATVTGATNSVVEFDYRPAGTIADGETRFGVIEVLYHDNQCRHLIFVSQGYGTVRMGSNDWMMGNLYSNGTEVDNPLMEGSMFKYGNAEYGIRASNNYSMDTPDRAAGPFKNAVNTKLNWVEHKYSGGSYSQPNTGYTSTYGAVKANLATGFTNAGLKKSTKWSGTYRVATYADYSELLDADRYGTLFGVLYGEEMDYTATSDVDRYTDAGDPSGMRGCFIYDRATGNHMFMPIGNTGNGRRKVTYSGSTKGYAVLKYANRDAEMDATTAAKLPLLYDIYRKPGALYWFQQYATEGSTKHYALDINYFTYLVNIYDTQILYYYGSGTSSSLTKFKSTKPASGTWVDENSDAAFVRRIKVSN